MKKQLTGFLFFAGLLAVFISVAFAQISAQTRSITSDDFASQRPKSKKLNYSNKNSRTKALSSGRTTYTFVRLDKNITRRKSAQAKQEKQSGMADQKIEKPEKVAEIGLTVWKLRPPNPSETGFKLLPVNVGGGREMWLAERVKPDNSFQAGDRVRMAIESSVSGYLYVVNSEIYSDGTFGAPSLIFPESSDEDNSVQPGLLVDIPDQTEDVPYYVMNPKKDNYAGELLTIIISPKPLTALKTDKDGKIKNLESLLDLEVAAEAEVYARNDAKDKIYSQSESEAACGSKARQQINRDLERPCGVKTRQLTREEPLPQTIYRVKSVAGQPAVAFIRLNVKN